MQILHGGMAEWFKAAVLKTVECNSSVGSNPTPSAMLTISMATAGTPHPPRSPDFFGEMAESAEGARLLSECVVKAAPRVRIPLSPPKNKKPDLTVGLLNCHPKNHL